mmetsp:Transcript_101392/g.316087  ORF Transcript_101392/g.316087 Transcript_101392/m.316087 type:complete len:377 (+) Transcript_101392:1-1131(+)
MAPAEGDGAGGNAGNGGFQLGFEMRPLTTDGDLDTSLDNKGLPHSVEHDMLYKMASENRESGNKMVGESKYEQAIGRYSEAIMQLRTLESETDVKWDDAARLKVRELRAAAYLNLSLCFVKTEQWTHASNTATRALQGDKTVPDPADAVLPPEKRAKALFRRAQAQCEGFGNFDKARDDLRKALEYTPGDKAVQQMLKKCDFAVKKTTKAADKKWGGFLKKEAQSGEGLFDDTLRPSEEAPKAKAPAEPMKLSDGLWVMPDNGQAKGSGAEGPEGEGAVDYEELGREIAEIKADKPEVYAQLRERVKELAEEAAGEAEAGEAGDKADKAAEATAEAAEEAAEDGAPGRPAAAAEGAAAEAAAEEAAAAEATAAPAL